MVPSWRAFQAATRVSGGMGVSRATFDSYPVRSGRGGGSRPRPLETPGDMRQAAGAPGDRSGPRARSHGTPASPSETPVSPWPLIHCDRHGDLPARFVCSHLAAGDAPLAVLATDDPEVFLCPACAADADRGMLTGEPSMICEGCVRELAGVHGSSTSRIDPELATATRSACVAMGERNERVRSLLTSGRYWYDLDDEILEFRDADETPRHRAHAVQVGSYFAPDRSWLWTWANPSLPGNQRVAAAYLRGFGRQRGWASWTDPGDDLSLDAAWHRALLACAVLDAVAFYRVPHDGGLHAFFALLDLRPCAPPADEDTRS